jgi:antirestriction protein ArdC
LGLTPEIREDHAPYIGHWLRVLTDDPKALFTAAAHAERAVRYLQERTGGSTAENEAGDAEET